MCGCTRMCVCVCVCVREREREMSSSADQGAPLRVLTPVILVRQMAVRLSNMNCLREWMTDLTKESNDWLLCFRNRGLVRFGVRHDEEGEGCGQHAWCLWVNCKEVSFFLAGQGQILASERALTHSRPHTHTLLCHMGYSCAKADIPIPEIERFS